MTKKTKLELTWPGKDERPQLEPRILIEHPGKSYRASEHHEGEITDNLLIKGDNLLALKALEAEHAGKVKCIYIDPPYNTGSAFEQYDDGLEHSLWLSMMRERLELLRRLLTPDGSIWISIDDNEAHYLKVLLDEVFARRNFIANIVWQKRYAPDVRIAISDAHENLLCYALDRDAFSQNCNLIPLEEAQTKQFRNPDSDSRGPWKASDFTAAGYRPNQMYEITLPSGRSVSPPAGRCWRVTVESFRKFESEDRMYYGSSGDNVPSLKRFLSEMQGMTPWTWWPHTEVGHSQEGKKESQAIFGRDNAFATPKPERLLRRILQIASKPGDLVLDSFAGSGTTGAVAHKMGRRWIMVEIGEHADSHIVPRLHAVIDGADQGGISQTANWKGGGGFRYFTLAPSLLERDRWGNLVISQDYDATMLAEAMCKHLGFAYAPSQDDSEYWRHGQSSETDFLYVTTQSLTYDALKLLSEEVGAGRTLMICARAFSGSIDAFSNLSCRKIPATILTKCEWGRDDYSLNVGKGGGATTSEVEHETADA